MAGLPLFRIIDAPAATRIAGQPIRYTGDDSLVRWTLGVYHASTCALLFVSSYRMIRLLGAMVAIGFVVSA